jgi:uncharacterized phage infection (PIP) family protein YhgE
MIVFVRLAPLTALLVTLSALAAGCGGSTSPEEKWAGDVCTQVTDWQNQVTQSTDDVSNQLHSPGAGTLNAIRADINSIVDATSKLASNLKSLGAPDTPSGAQAKQQVDSFATQLNQAAQQARQTAASVPPGASITDIVSKVASLGPAVQTLANNASTTLKSVQSSAQSLKDGFAKADSCKPFRSLTGSS